MWITYIREEAFQKEVAKTMNYAKQSFSLKTIVRKQSKTLETKRTIDKD